MARWECSNDIYFGGADAAKGRTTGSRSAVTGRPRCARHRCGWRSQERAALEYGRTEFTLIAVVGI